MLQLNNLEKLTKNRKRVGRGGGRGGTSGRGHKGQKSRPGAGGELKDFFEGGQMPLARRIPRRGFKNFMRVEATVVNLDDLERCFEDGAIVNKDTLKACGLIKGMNIRKIKVLGNGSLTKSLTVCVDSVSKTAIDEITKNKGKVELSKEFDSGSAAT